jgi:hypothetical protein
MATQAELNFINEVKVGAQAGQQKYGVLASLTIAQAIEESGWGQRTIANNLFGIKANGYKPCISVSTKEFERGEYVNTVAEFRAYPNFAASVEDHGSFLAANSRYKNILNVSDSHTVTTRIQADGYSTSPTYSVDLDSLIKEYNLTQYDIPQFPGAQYFGAGKSNVYIQELSNALVLHDKLSRIFASKTWSTHIQSAVTAFQKAQGWSGINANGLPGAETWRLLGL